MNLFCNIFERLRFLSILYNQTAVLRNGEVLFDNIITSSTHPLHILLPPKAEKHYSTRPRGHCYQLPRKTTALDESNFFYRLLHVYRDILSFTFTD